MVDDYLVATNLDAIQSMILLLGTLIFVSAVNPWLFLFTIPLLCIFIYIRQYYLQAGREIKRIEAAERSPIFSHLASSLVGIPIIRSLDASNRFIQEMDTNLDLHNRAFYMFLTASRWLGLRLDLLSAALVLVVTFAAIGLQDTVSAGLAALSISYTLQLTGSLQWYPIF